MSGSESTDGHVEEALGQTAPDGADVADRTPETQEQFESAESAAPQAESAQPPSPRSEDWAAPDAAQAASVAAPAMPALTDQTPTTQVPIPQSTASLEAVTQPGFPQQGYAQPGFAQPVSPQPAYPQTPAYAYPGYAPQAPYAPASNPAVPKRKRLLWIVGAAVVVLGLISAGVYALLPGRTGNSIVSAVTCRPTDLTTCLIKAPAGGVRLSGDGKDQWPQQTVASADEYASNITADSQGVGGDAVSLLSQDGFSTVAHTDWNAVDGDNIDIVLLAFSTQKGAQAWNSTRAAEILAAYPGPVVTIPGDSTGKAHAAVKADAKGERDAGYSTVVGNIVLNLAYSSPNQLSTPDLRNWAGTELASLRTAPAPAADPAPTAPGTEQVACGSGLRSCLMAEPGDGQAWTSSTDKHWVAGHSLTSAQYVHLFWDEDSASVQQQVLSNFASDGVTGIAHEDWSIDNGDEQADVYVIQTITADGAKQLTSSNFGEPQWSKGLSGISFTIPNSSYAQAWRTNKTDSSGFIEFAYTATVGNVIVLSWLYFYGSFDSSTAKSWAKPELDRIQSSAHTVPMGLFPLTAPALPAAHQGTCASSGDCLLSLPAGVSDTTSSSYQTSTSINAAAYADQYETGSSYDITTWLASDGFASAEHRAWTASNGATADAVLLKYHTPAQAQAAAMLEFGVNASEDRVCTDAAVPDSLCLATPVSTSDPLQDETIWVLAWKGDYEVSVSVTIANSADLVQAYTWARQQLDELPAS